jgi:hypothetical protein
MMVWHEEGEGKEVEERMFYNYVLRSLLGIRYQLQQVIHVPLAYTFLLSVLNFDCRRGIS